MDKRALRKRYQDIRDALPLSDRAVWSKAITNGLLRFPQIQEAQSVFLYDAMRSEVETAALADALLHLGKTVCFPRLDTTVPGKMEAVPVRSRQDLVPGPFGTRQPMARLSPIDPARIDIVLTPGLAFTREGVRLGYGGGYYDRFFPQCDAALRIALCYTAQLAEALPLDPHDVPMHILFTESYVLHLH